jgi:CheY-like chemotaxis protein
MVVLIVEDAAIIAYCSAAVLEDAGHEVLGPADTSQAALELVRHRKPDVAVVDIDLEIPGAGIGLARHLCATSAPQSYLQPAGRIWPALTRISQWACS